MSLQGRATHDYSPLRPHMADKHGRDARTRKERQDYDAAVNARREMLETLASQPQPKLTKKQYERLVRGTSVAGKHVLRGMLK